MLVPTVTIALATLAAAPAALAGTPATLAAAPAGAGAAADVRATTPDCDRDARTAAFEGDMRSRPGTHRMQMRFALQTLVDGRWSRVRASGFGPWQTSHPGVARYVFTRRVENLPAPGAYRARVVFRWLDGQDLPLARVARRTPECRIGDPRPDLQPAAVVAHPGGWAVVVRNTGRSRAGAFRVAATADGVPLEPRGSDGLGPDEEVTVPFAGPCATSVRVTVDPDGSVAERDEDDNVLEAACPPTG